MDDFTVIAGFLETIALETAKRTQNRLREEAQLGNITLTELGRKAADMMVPCERHAGLRKRASRAVTIQPCNFRACCRTHQGGSINWDPYDGTGGFFSEAFS